jgi:hypothetical protein
MYRIRETGPNSWQLSRIADGHLLTTRRTYAGALAAMVASGGLVAAAAELGVLPELWEDDGGLAFSERTGDGRDFTACEWMFRDPNASLLPLMLQTETEMGHFGAELAGFHTAISVDAGTVHGSGRFYDNEAGAAFVGLLNGSTRFGVSVDPGEVDVEWRCIAQDEEGWCQEEEAAFTRYEVIGTTGTPFPAFANAAIRFSTASPTAEQAPAEPAPAEQPAMAAAARVMPATWRPEASWFQMAEPDEASGLLVEQLDGAGDPVGLACPLTVDGRQVYGHLAYWGQCHIGYPGLCISPPNSELQYAPFYHGPDHFLRAAGSGVECADGTIAAAGPVTVACDHALAHLRAPEARDYYAHTGLQWADVAVVDGTYGPWACGALRPDVTEDQIQVIKAGGWSGDWRELGGNLELIGVLAVTIQGFPVQRRQLAASGLTGMAEAGQPRVHIQNGEQVSLIGGAMVRRCPECQRRAMAAQAGQLGPSLTEFRELLAKLDLVERRTRHLVPAQAAAEVAALG